MAAVREVELLLKRDEEELEIVENRLQAVKAKLQEAREALAGAVSEFEAELRKRWEREKTKESAGMTDEWDAPSRDEVVEDEREDERMAREEAEALAQWVPRDVLTVGGWVERDGGTEQCWQPAGTPRPRMLETS